MREILPADDYDRAQAYALADDIADEVAHTGRFAHDDDPAPVHPSPEHPCNECAAVDCATCTVPKGGRP